MSHPSDKDLDRLSREAAEQYDVEQNTSGWEKLQQRLDEELPREEDKDRKRFLWFLLLITVLGGSGLVWVTQNLRNSSGSQHNIAGRPHEQSSAMAEGNNDDHISAPKQSDNRDILQRAEDNNDTRSAQKSTTNKKAPARIHAPEGSNEAGESRKHRANNPISSAHARSAEHSTVVNEGRKPADKDHGPSTASLSASRSPALNSNRKNSSDKAFSKQLPPGDSKALTNSKRNIKNRTHQITSIAENVPALRHKGNRKDINEKTRARPGAGKAQKDELTRTGENEDITRNDKNNSKQHITDKAQEINKETDIVRDSTSAGSQNNAPLITDTLQKVKPVSPLPDSSATGTKKTLAKKQMSERGLEIGIIAGPDVSNVAFRNANKTGYNVGFQIGYRLSGRWSVNTGIIYTRKNYDARAEDYHPVKAYVWGAMQLDKLEGYCQMLDIPVNVRYNFTIGTKATWFASTGISSYLMKKQYYDYYTHNTTTGQQNMYGWTYGKDSSYLFSILNLSAGWERSLNKHFSIQAEPYLKIPLKGIGYGRMQINSYGFLLSIKYKPTFRSAR